MSKCLHSQIRTFRTTDDLQPAGLWACLVCGHKFVPLDLSTELGAGRYRQLRAACGWPAVFASSDAPEPLTGVDLDDALDKASRVF